MNVPDHVDLKIGTLGQGYNLGDILNMPAFWDKRSLSASRADLAVVASQLPQSIAGLYYNCRSNGLGDVAADPLMPYRPRLLCAVNESIAAQPEIHPIIKLLQDNSVLCVHVRSGDYGPVTNNFLRTIADLSKQFPKIIVISGVHCNGEEQFIARNKAKLNRCLNKIRALVPHAIFDFNHPDAHVCYMARARNLLVHAGGFSILGSLVFSGKNLYVTSAFQPHAKNNKLWHDLKIPHQIISNAIDMRFSEYEMPMIRMKSVMPTRVAMPSCVSRVTMPTRVAMPSRAARVAMPSRAAMPTRVAMPSRAIKSFRAMPMPMPMIGIPRKNIRPMRMNLHKMN